LLGETLWIFFVATNVKFSDSRKYSNFTLCKFNFFAPALDVGGFVIIDLSDLTWTSEGYCLVFVVKFDEQQPFLLCPFRFSLESKVESWSMWEFRFC
jgi:hypothetical protein